MTASESFSDRYGYRPKADDIKIREDAPRDLREFVIYAAGQHLTGLAMDVTIADVANIPAKDRVMAAAQHRSSAESRVQSLPWYTVYELIERFWKDISQAYKTGPENAARYSKKINDFFIAKGIGWQLVDGKVVTRGSEASEHITKTTIAALESSGRPTAAKHIREALADLSRRPEADLHGAVYHGLGSLECVARDITNDPKATLGEILKRYPDLLPKPVDEALAKLWGFASNEARHVVEGREPGRSEAEFLVGLSAVIATYLNAKVNSDGPC